MRILALDQASRISGWAVFDDGELYNYGKFSATQTDVGDRLHYIRKEVEELSKEEYKDQLAIICIDLNNNFILGDPNSWVRARFENALRVGKITSISDKPLLDYLNDRKCYDVTSLHVNVKDPSTLHDWIHKLREMFDQHFDIYASGPINIEFMKPGINKGHGVRSIMKLYGLEEHEIAVAGDNQNDISMFFTTHYSYCMSTATPQVQKYAYKVVDSKYTVIIILSYNY